VVNGMLDYTKLRAGKLTLLDEHFNLHNLVEECAHLCRHLHAAKPVRMLVRCTLQHTGEREPAADCAGLCLVGAPLHLKQVLVNLLTNAFKHTELGCVTLTAAATVDGSYGALPRPAQCMPSPLRAVLSAHVLCCIVCCRCVSSRQLVAEGVRGIHGA
jgi:signal transduction histidine kinase